MRLLIILSVSGIFGFLLYHLIGWYYTRGMFPKYRVRYWSKPVQGAWESQVKTSYFMPWSTIRANLEAREPLQDVFGTVTMDQLKIRGDVLSLPKDAIERIEAFDREYRREKKGREIESVQGVDVDGSDPVRKD